MSDFAPLTVGELKRLCEWLYRRTGMMFDAKRRYYVERRLSDRMSATGIDSFEPYFAFLRCDARAEIEKFVNSCTVNETYFYREPYQFACLASDLLDARLRARENAGPLRIWSVPCSTGDEAYSIAIWLLENWPSVDAHDIEIVGSDIDTDALAHARAGVYGKRALMRLPEHLVAKYFEPLEGERWRIIEDLRNSVQFTSCNLIDRSTTLPNGAFDVIFCRNALIYFDDLSRREAAENLYENLAPGGYICLGHSESMSRISPLFEVERFADAIVYKRPLENR